MEGGSHLNANPSCFIACVRAASHVQMCVKRVQKLLTAGCTFSAPQNVAEVKCTTSACLQFLLHMLKSPARHVVSGPASESLQRGLKEQ